MELCKVLNETYGPFMDIPELAETLKIKPETIYQQIYRGKFTMAHLRHGKKYLFSSDEVAQHLEKELSKVC